MKNLIIGGVILVTVGMLASQTVQAQGTTYLSSLDQPSASSNPVASDSWLATGFRTGTNSARYVLDSIQLLMLDAAGSPAGFTVSVYSAIGQLDVFPGSSLGTLNGSMDPVTGGIYSYTPASDLTLSPTTFYFIIATAGTPVATGAYEWSNSGTFPISYNPISGWQAPVGLGHNDNYQSSDGLSWSISGVFPQFAINATPIPEPGVLILLGLAGLGLLWSRGFAKR